MREIDLFDDESGATVFRDVIMLALAGFVMIVMLLLPHINPRAAEEQETKSPGNVIVELRWPDHIDADVDLWVEGPGDNPVGYSNKDGAVFRAGDGCNTCKCNPEGTKGIGCSMRKCPDGGPAKDSKTACTLSMCRIDGNGQACCFTEPVSSYPICCAGPTAQDLVKAYRGCVRHVEMVDRTAGR